MAPFTYLYCCTGTKVHSFQLREKKRMMVHNHNHQGNMKVTNTLEVKHGWGRRQTKSLLLFP